MPTEFQLIERFLAPFARRGGGVVIGPGDDCAVLRPSRNAETCVTVDAIVEGVHFDPALFSDADIGYKALAVNLSDLASMGATPRWFLCSIACRPADAARIPRIARGMADLARRSGIVLAGGNFTRADILSIHLTAAGEVPVGKALRRDTARPGDLVYVTGTLGDAALGLALVKLGRHNPKVHLRQRRPEPRLEAGLIARRFASACIDLSDGLLQDLSHVVETSRVGLRIDAARVPLSRTFVDLAANRDLALTGGEDYELAICVPPRRAKAFERAMAAGGQQVTQIGEVVRKRGLSVLHAPHLGAQGWDHFRKPRG